MSVHLLMNPMDRKAICGTVAGGYGVTLSEEAVTCGACLSVVELWKAQDRAREAEALETEALETEANLMARGYGMLRTWE